MPVLKPLSGSGDAPSQHKQPSRKGKKAWRKNVDISEVQEGLEDLNEELIQGGVTTEKDSADLFTVDTLGDSTAPASKKKQRATKTLKADEIIAQRSAVPAVSLRKRPAPKTSDGILPAKRQRSEPWVSHAEVARLRRVADGQHESTIAQQDATYDMWGDAAPAPAPAIVKSTAVTKSATPSSKAVAEKANRDATDITTVTNDDNFLPPENKAKPPKSLRHKPISLAASGKSVPAVAKPAGSHSYNPLFEDYAARLRFESDKAVDAERKRLAKEEADRLRTEAVARSAAEADAAEARAELSEWDEDSAWEGFETDVDDEEEEGETNKNGSGSDAKKQPKRKTTVQRNRVKRRKADEGQRKHDAAMKALDKQAEKIRQIAAEVAQREAQRRALSGNSDSDADDDEEEELEDVGAEQVKLRRKKLGKMKLSDEGDLELILPDELQDSLRLLKPEGNLLKDRYRSMLVRGRVDSRRRIPFKKKPNTRFTEKWAYKDFKL